MIREVAEEFGQIPAVSGQGVRRAAPLAQQPFAPAGDRRFDRRLGGNRLKGAGGPGL